MVTDPIDPPVPVLDVPGADAGRRGLPKRSELTALQRTTVDASVIADLGLRTAVASMIGAAMLPKVLTELVHPTQASRDRDALTFYADLAAQHSAKVSFPAPVSPPEVTTRPANPLARWVAHGNVENLQFDSSFRAINPEIRDLWNGLQRNNVVHAQHWRHGDGPRRPRPTRCP